MTRCITMFSLDIVKTSPPVFSSLIMHTVDQILMLLPNCLFKIVGTISKIVCTVGVVCVWSVSQAVTAVNSLASVTNAIIMSDKRYNVLQMTVL